MRRYLPAIRPEKVRLKEPAYIMRLLRDAIEEPRHVRSTNKLELFEARLADFLGVAHACLFPSGKLALAAILKAFALEEKARIAVPTWTCLSIPKLLVENRFDVVPIDVSPINGTIDPEKLALLESHKPAVILATHILGNPCRMSAIGKWAEKNGVVIVEDCAHAIGARVDGRQVGGFGRAGFVSFAAFKPLYLGGGGAAFTDDDALAQSFKSIQPHYFTESLWSAAIKNVTQELLWVVTTERLFDLVGRRLWAEVFTGRENIAFYKRYLRPFLKRGADNQVSLLPHPFFMENSRRCNIDGFAGLLALRRRRIDILLEQVTPHGEQALILAPRKSGVVPSYQYLYMKSPRRREVIRRLYEQGICAVSPEPTFWEFKTGRPEEMEVGRALSNQQIMLPWFDSMTEPDVVKLGLAIKNVLKSS